MTSQPPPPQQAYAYPLSQRTNGPAIASLVCGLVGCVPFITSLAAVVLGVVGLKKTRDPSVGGKGFAIAGLVLGIMGMGGWTIFGGALYAAYAASKPARVVANQFAVDLSNGNTAAALAATAGMTAQQLDPVVQQIQPWGTLTGTRFPSFRVSTTAAGTRCDLTGTADFSTGGTKVYTVRLIKANNEYKVESFDFR